MYKLIINNIQIGNFKNMKDMMHSIAFSSVLGPNTKKMKWIGKKLYITTLDR